MFRVNQRPVARNPRQIRRPAPIVSLLLFYVMIRLSEMLVISLINFALRRLAPLSVIELNENGIARVNLTNYGLNQVFHFALTAVIFKYVTHPYARYLMTQRQINYFVEEQLNAAVALAGTVSILRRLPLPQPALSGPYRHCDLFEAERAQLDLPLPDELMCPILFELMKTPVYLPHAELKELCFEEKAIDDMGRVYSGSFVRHPHKANVIADIRAFKINTHKQQLTILFLKILGDYIEQHGFLALSGERKEKAYVEEILPKYQINARMPSRANMIKEASMIKDWMRRNSFFHKAQPSNSVEQEEKRIVLWTESRRGVSAF